MFCVASGSGRFVLGVEIVWDEGVDGGDEVGRCGWYVSKR
jgi:hypothetical protein